MVMLFRRKAQRVTTQRPSLLFVELEVQLLIQNACHLLQHRLSLALVNLPQPAPLAISVIRFDLLVNKPAPGAARFHHRSQKGGGGFPSPWSTPPPVFFFFLSLFFSFSLSLSLSLTFICRFGCWERCRKEVAPPPTRLCVFSQVHTGGGVMIF